MDAASLVAFVRTELRQRGDSTRAEAMAAYMKTDMPFYGVGSPARREVLRMVRGSYAPSDKDDYRTAVTALWEGPSREEKHLAIDYAIAHRMFVKPAALDLYRRMVVEGAWWDLVDPVATHLIGSLHRADPEAMSKVLGKWIVSDDMWLRRTAILAQLKHKHATDRDLLFEFCLTCAHESEFFIRRAIGWALREYAKTDPDAVTTFLQEHRAELSGLSFREASKHLDMAT